MPLIVDNTVASPWLIRPLEWGADIVVQSATKFIGGHGTSIGGVIVDGGTFDFSANDKFPMFTEPDPSYHGLTYWPALGKGSYIIKARVQLLRDMGPAVTPFNSFLFLQGLETLSLRMERHNANARAVADHQAGHPQVESVQFAGLPGSRWHERANRYTGGRGYGSVPAFVIKGGKEAGQRFVEALELHSHVANIGDVRSLVIHPASTTQRGRSAAPGLGRPVAHPSLAARKPASRSAMMSSSVSRPTDRRTRPGSTPVVTCSCSVSWECVVEAGWMARLRTSPMLATWLCSSRASTKA